MVAALIATSAFAKVGLTGGISLSPDNVSFKDVKQWHAGLTWEIPLGIGFSIQPSLLYASKAGLPDGGTSIEAFKMGYVQLPVQLLWGPDLAAGNFKPYVFADVFLGYNLTKNDEWAKIDNINQVRELLDWGFGLGVGIKVFKHLQVTAKYVFDLGNLTNLKPVNWRIPDCITFGAAILF